MDFILSCIIAGVAAAGLIVIARWLWARLIDLLLSQV